jgi:hypothetical protein
MRAMAETRTLRGIGRKLREASRDVVEAELPHRVRVLLESLACVEAQGKLRNGDASR